MIPRTFLSTYASNGQQQMAVVFLTDITGLKRWADYIPVKLSQGGSENSYANNGYVDVVSVVKTSTMRPFAEYVPVYVDNSASDAWQVSATGYIPYGFAGFGGASMVMDFTNGAELDSRITFTRASTATRTNASGIIESVATNTARFDYDPTTLAPLGLLIEESRTNLFTYSEQFDNAAWTKTNSTITANAVVSPDGTMDGDKHIPNNGVTIGTGASETRVYQSPSVTSGTSYTYSMYAKAGEYDQLALAFITSPSVSAVFSLTLGTIISGTGATITSVGNGWYRCSLTTAATSTGTLQMRWSAESSTVSTGDGTSGIYIWGAQLEAGAFATSYIPTVASQVTRATDLASMTGTNFSSWYNATEGTFFAEWTLGQDVTGICIYTAEDGTTSNYIRLRYGASGTQNDSAVAVGGVTQASLAASNQQTLNTTYKNAMAYKVNDFARSASGAAVITDTSGTIPTVTQLSIGKNAANTEPPNGYIRQIAYYPRRLTNAELQGITA
jgi:hypothetical protein